MTPRDKLLRAADLIEEVYASLDDKPSVCPGCARTHYGNWAARQAINALESMPDKLRRTAGRADAFVPAQEPKLRVCA